MPRYDASCDEPPAPVAAVTLYDARTGASVADVRLLLDTGSSVTMLPRAAVLELGAPILTDRAYEVMGLEGSRMVTSAVEVVVVVLGHAFRGRFLLLDEERGILGRNLLNSLSLVLDGPRQEWREHSG